MSRPLSVIVPARAGRESRDEVEHGGLAGTVGPDHPDDLARPDVERASVDGADAAEAHRQVRRTDRIGWAVRSVAASLGFVGVVGRWRRSGEEHGTQQVGTFEQFLRRTVEHDRAAFHEVRPLGDGQRHVDALLHQHDRHAVVGHPPNDRQQLADDDRCEAQRQLVDQQHLRAHHEAHREREHLLLAARHVRRRRVESAGEHREDLQHLGGGRRNTRAGRADWSSRRVRGSPERVSEPNTPWPPGIWTMPSAAISFGGAWVMSRPSSTMAPRSASTMPLIAFSRVDLPAPFVPRSATTSPSSRCEVDAVEHGPVVVAGLDAAQQQQVGVALPAVVEHLGAGRRRLPHLDDVVVDHVGDAAQDEAADDEHGDQDEHPDLDAPVVGDPPDQGQDGESGDHPQRSDREAGRPGPRRNRQRQRSQYSGPDDREGGRDHAVERNGDVDVRGERESRRRDRGEDRDRCDEPDEALDVADEPSGGDARADDEPDERERLGRRRRRHPDPVR